jgi:hypothetical protein
MCSSETPWNQIEDIRNDKVVISENDDLIEYQFSPVYLPVL